MNQEKQLLEQALSELQARRENTDREAYGPLIEGAEALIQKYGAGGAGTKMGDETLAALYFLTAELLFEKDLATRKATRGKNFENEAKALERSRFRIKKNIPMSFGTFYLLQVIKRRGSQHWNVLLNGRAARQKCFHGLPSIF